ncbi:MAG: peptide ABC transporter substrate-binding protein [Alphaproteobacteria bacterium]
MLRHAAKSAIGSFITVIALWLMLPASLAQADEPETLTIGISQFPSTLHPSFDSMLAKTYIAAMARRPITVYDHDWQVTCLLCTALPDMKDGTARFEKTSDGEDGLAVDYALDPNAVWGDGIPITTKDVLFTWDVGRNPDTGIDNFELYRRILSIEAHDAQRFTLHWDRRTCDYKSINDFALLPAHIERPVFEEDPATYRNRTTYDRNPSTEGLWFGPYKVSDVAPGSSITLVRNPLWWGKEPYFDRIVVRTIENTAALIANILSGDIDMIAGEGGITMDQALSFERRHGDDYNIVYKESLIYEHLDLMLDNPILQDIRVRRALLRGIDRQAISKKLFDGRQPVANGSVNPLDSVYLDDVPKYPFDPDAAAELLNLAGWTTGADGIRRDANGNRLSLILQTTAGNKTRELVAQVLQNQWRDIGVDVTIKNEPARILFGETLSQRKFTGMAMFAWFSSPRNVPRTTLHSEMIPSEDNAWSGQNYTGYADPEMDRILEDLELVCEPGENQALWDRLQVKYAEDLPVLPLYYRADAFILPTWLKGLRPTGHQYPSTNWVEEWHRED